MLMTFEPYMFCAVRTLQTLIYKQPNKLIFDIHDGAGLTHQHVFINPEKFIVHVENTFYC